MGYTESCPMRMIHEVKFFTHVKRSVLIVCYILKDQIITGSISKKNTLQSYIKFLSNSGRMRINMVKIYKLQDINYISASGPAT
jgi:hypothetical protein